MGAFFLVRKGDCSDGQSIEEGHWRRARPVFEGKGLTLNKRLDSEHHAVYVFHKHKFEVDNVVELANGDFAVSTGTCIYRGRTGSEALRLLHEEFSEDGKFERHLRGNYCVVIRRGSQLHLLNDWAGLYRVYSDPKHAVISSSFLAVAKTLESKTISEQEFYEYVSHGACFGEQTFLKEVQLLDSHCLWRLSPEPSTTLRAVPADGLDPNSSFDEMVRAVAAHLVEYFEVLKVNFGNSVCSALTGGFDCRLVLALMRHVGIEPSYLYVYDDSRFPDCVPIARQIARGEGLALEHESRATFPKPGAGEFDEIVKRQFFLLDGLGHERGVFDDGWGLYSRLKRVENARLHLNGGGGEVMRNFWRLPDRPVDARTFVKERFDSVDRSSCSGRFSADRYLDAHLNKIRDTLGTTDRRLSRRQAEMLFPLWRVKYWMGPNNSINNQLSYALTPLAEAPFVFLCLDIPVKYKDYGRFEAAVIEYLDPALARYVSQHGYSFSGRIPLRARAKYLAKQHAPSTLRSFLRRHMWDASRVKLSLRGGTPELPFYLRPDYLGGIFETRDLNISEYLNVDSINDPGLLARALSVELLLSNRF